MLGSNLPPREVKPRTLKSNTIRFIKARLYLKQYISLVDVIKLIQPFVILQGGLVSNQALVSACVADLPSPSCLIRWISYEVVTVEFPCSLSWGHSLNFFMLLLEEPVRQRDH